MVGGGGHQPFDLGVDGDRRGAGRDFGGVGVFAGGGVAVHAGFGAPFKEAFFQCDAFACGVHFAVEGGGGRVDGAGGLGGGGGDDEAGAEDIDDLPGACCAGDVDVARRGATGVIERHAREAAYLEVGMGDLRDEGAVSFELIDGVCCRFDHEDVAARLFDAEAADATSAK